MRVPSCEVLALESFCCPFFSILLEGTQGCYIVSEVSSVGNEGQMWAPETLTINDWILPSAM